MIHLAPANEDIQRDREDFLSDLRAAIETALASAENHQVFFTTAIAALRDRERSLPRPQLPGADEVQEAVVRMNREFVQCRQ